MSRRAGGPASRLTALFAGIALACLAGGTAACSSGKVTDLELTDATSGFYDAGLKDGMNHLVPSVTFRLRNKGTEPINAVQLQIGFWRDRDDGEWDSVLVRGVGSTALAPGATTDPILVRSTVGYNLEGPRAELFNHGSFRDVTAKIFGKKQGRPVPIGEIKLERKVLPNVPTGPGRP